MPGHSFRGIKERLAGLFFPSLGGWVLSMFENLFRLDMPARIEVAVDGTFDCLFIIDADFLCIDELAFALGVSK